MRAIWSGTISFGLVNIPVKLGSAVQSEGLDFDMLSKKDMAPIRYARIDTKTNKEVAWQDIVKGFEYTKGKYVIVEDDDFKKASPEKSQSIDIIQFVKQEEIDPIYFEKPYFLVPGKGGEKSYRLLVKALEKTGAVGIAEFMLRNRQHICMLKVHENILMLEQLRYHEEIREIPDVGSAKADRVTEKELNLAVKLIDQLTEKFNPKSFKDTYVDELKKLIKAKAQGKQIKTVEPRKPAAPVKDLMDVLQASLEKRKERKRA